LFRPLLPILLLLAFHAPAAARVVEDQQIWANFTVIGSAGRFAYFAEVQPRTADGLGRLGQLLLRPAVGWKLSDGVTLYGGYARIVLPARTGPGNHEDRFFTQLSWDLGTLAGGRVSSRSRVEHRRLATGDDAGWRVRQMLRYVHPLGDPRRPRALVHAELFAAFNDTDWGARKGFDQARTFAGFEFPLLGRSTVEAGYLNQSINDPAGRWRVNHVASLILWIRP
jgi:hypothetical protein